MSELNIWGLTGCVKPDGTPCKQCCESKAIDTTDYNGNFIQVGDIGFIDREELFATQRFLKAPGFLCSKADKSGCSEYDQRPNPCRHYWCGNDTPEEKTRLIKDALSAGEITQDHADQALQRVLMSKLGIFLTEDFADDDDYTNI